MATHITSLGSSRIRNRLKAPLPRLLANSSTNPSLAFLMVASSASHASVFLCNHEFAQVLCSTTTASHFEVCSPAESVPHEQHILCSTWQTSVLDIRQSLADNELYSVVDIFGRYQRCYSNYPTMENCSTSAELWYKKRHGEGTYLLLKFTSFL